jgi:hypothetical protein
MQIAAASTRATAWLMISLASWERMVSICRYLVVDHQQRMIIRAEQRLGWICRYDISPLAGVM